MHRYIQHVIPFSLLFLSIFLCNTTLNAQSALIESLKVDEVLHDIIFRNDVEGYALSSQGAWHTTDAGMTWVKFSPLVFRTSFTAIALFGENGIIIGDETGGIHITSHPDSIWISSLPGKGHRIKEIEAIDHDRWIAITDSLLLSTIDGGVTYRQFEPENGYRLSSIDITDESLMHVSADTYWIWRSTDGGATWNQIHTGDFGFGNIYDVQFTSADIGFVASWYPWNLFTTIDGGKTWSQGPFEYPSSIAINRDGIGAYTTGDYIRLSNDGGMNWVDSLNFATQFPEDEMTNYTNQKVVIAGQNTIFLLLSNTELNRSIIARVDILSGVKVDRSWHPLPLDLSMRE